MELLILGASARAAAQSARRAGFTPYAIDRYGDQDLSLCAERHAKPLDGSDASWLACLEQMPVCPWIYTGGLENRPALIERIARDRPLWGNGPEVLARVRNPIWVQRTLFAAGLPALEVATAPDDVPRDGSWLVKPLRSAGGRGVEPWRGQEPSAEPRYWQRYANGFLRGALFVGQEGKARLLGVTSLLSGNGFSPFVYVGNAGPWTPDHDDETKLEEMGSVLARASGMRGLFGLDLVMNARRFQVLEVNPRYTASAEVLEHALGISTVDVHSRVFGLNHRSPRRTPARARGFAAKVVLYAPADLTWTRELRSSRPIDPGRPPCLADIPPPGTPIATGHPVLTLLTTSRQSLSSLDRVMERHNRIQKWLNPG